MRNITQPSFITFIIGAVLFFIGIGMRANSSDAGTFLLFGGVGLMGIFWVWSIVKVVTAADMRPFQKRFWMIAVIAVPVLGGLLFHIMHRKAGKIIS